MNVLVLGLLGGLLVVALVYSVIAASLLVEAVCLYLESRQ